MDTNTHDIAAILMALDDFKDFAAAKIEVYNETLIELGATPHITGQLAVEWGANGRVRDRDRIDAWKARILAGDDHYPEETP
jgi:hypothetical protein